MSAAEALAHAPVRSEGREDALNAAFAEKVKRGIFRPVARLLTGYPDPEDQLQDAICQTWWVYRRRALERGQLLPDAILVHLCKLKARSLDHRFVPGERRRRCEDVHDARARRRGRGATAPLTSATDQPAPTRVLDGEMDLCRFAGSLCDLDQEVLSGNYAGESTTDLARRLGYSISAIHGRERRLGARLRTYLSANEVS